MVGSDGSEGDVGVHSSAHSEWNPLIAPRKITRVTAPAHPHLLVASTSRFDVAEDVTCKLAGKT